MVGAKSFLIMCLVRIMAMKTNTWCIFVNESKQCGYGGTYCCRKWPTIIGFEQDAVMQPPAKIFHDCSSNAGVTLGLVKDVNIPWHLQC